MTTLTMKQYRMQQNQLRGIMNEPNVVLPPVLLTEEDRKKAAQSRCNPKRLYVETHPEYHCRERQFLASIAENRLLQRTNDVLTRTVAATIERASKSEAENRQKDAENTELTRKGQEFCAAYGIALIEIGDLKRELRSLGGERWIEIKEGCEMPDFMQTVLLIWKSTLTGELFQEVNPWGAQPTPPEALECGITHWKPLNWPLRGPTNEGEGVRR